MKCLFQCGALVLLAAAPRAAEPDPLFRIPWGAAETELGLIDIPEVERVGPTSFCLDDSGDIYLCDFVNRSVKKFLRDGSFAGVVAGGIAANHVAVSPRGAVYARCDGGRIVAFSGGRRVASFQLPPGLALIEGYEQAVSVIPAASGPAAAALVAVNDPAQLHYAVLREEPDGVPLGLAARGKTLRYPGRPLRDGFACRPEWKRRDLGLLRRFSPSGREENPVSIQSPDSLGSIAFKGADRAGRLYLEIERITPDNYVHLHVRVYSTAGELIRSFELPNDYYTTVYRKTWLEPDGSVIHMQTTPEGVSFTAWR